MFRVKHSVSPDNYKREEITMPTEYKTIRKYSESHGLQLDFSYLRDGIVSIEDNEIGTFHTFRQCEVIVDSILENVCNCYSINNEDLRILSESFRLKVYLDRCEIENLTIRRSFLGYTVTEHKDGKREIAIIATKKLNTVIKKLYLAGRLPLPSGDIPRFLEEEIVKDLFVKCKSIIISLSPLKKSYSRIEKVDDKTILYAFNDVDGKRKFITFNF